MDHQTVLHVKRLLWDGFTQMDTGVMAGVSTTTVYKILHGYSDGDVPWPDGSTGAMPKERMEEIKREKRKKRFENINVRHNIPDEGRVAVREVLSKARIEQDKEHEERLLRAIHDGAETPVDAPDSVKDVPGIDDPERVWKDALKHIPNNIHVKAAKKNMGMRKYLCDALSSIPFDMWRDGAMLDKYMELYDGNR